MANGGTLRLAGADTCGDASSGAAASTGVLSPGVPCPEPGCFFEWLTVGCMVIEADFDPTRDPMTEQPDMRKTFLQSKLVSSAPEAVAPDGSDVRLLCQTQRGSMAHFTLRAGAVSKAVAHRTIDELWYFVSGRGRMWRRLDDLEEVTAVKAGISIAIPVGTHFQFRSDSPEALAAVGVTMPPWPGEGEAYDVKGYWDPTV